MSPLRTDARLMVNDMDGRTQGMMTEFRTGKRGNENALGDGADGREPVSVSCFIILVTDAMETKRTSRGARPAHHCSCHLHAIFHAILPLSLAMLCAMLWVFYAVDRHRGISWG